LEIFRNNTTEIFWGEKYEIFRTIFLPHITMGYIVVCQETEMGETLEVMSKVSDDLLAWTPGNRRRAAYQLDNEWTRSVYEHVYLHEAEYIKM